MEGYGWPSGIPRANLRESLTSYSKAYGSHLRSNATAFGQFVRRVLPADWDTGKRLAGIHKVISGDGEMIDIDRPNGYMLPSLEVCRRHWEHVFGGKFKWEDAPGTTIEKSLGLQEEVF